MSFANWRSDCGGTQLRVWFDEWDIEGHEAGRQPAKRRSSAGLEHSRVLVLCMSAHAFGANWAQFGSHHLPLSRPAESRSPLHTSTA